MRVDDAVRRAMVEGASTAQVRKLARAAGMRSLRESGLRVVLEGTSTIEELRRETMDSW
jgi:type II secretory ATPase GspE/PulE/Tfp pilus assembly ATPase PilB-like protein